MSKKTWKKIGKVTAIIALILVALVIIKIKIDENANQQRLMSEVVELKRLQNEIVRSQSTYVSKEDLKNFAKQNDIDLAPILKDLKALGAEIQGISKLLAESKGYKGTNLGSSGTIPRVPDPSDSTDVHLQCSDGSECEDLYGYWNNSQSLNLFEPFSDKLRVPIGDVTFEAWKEKPWSASILPRKYHVNTVLGVDENDRHYVHNQFQIEVDGKKHNIPVSQSEFVEKMPEAEFRFDPHVNLGVTVGVLIATGSTLPSDESKVHAEVSPELSVSLFSYGQTRSRPSWKFLGLGVNYETQESTLGFQINPADYNIGGPIPFIDNIYIGPSVGVDIKGKVMVGVGVRIGL